MKNLLYLLSCVFLYTTCVPIAQQVGQTSGTGAESVANKPLRTIDYVYEENIKTVTLYPQIDPQADQTVATLQAPVIPLTQGTPLMLNFDQIGSGFTNYRAKIYHCDADWKLSILNDIEYLEEYNDFIITQYKLSFNTKVPYVHYTFEVPRVKISGNYVVMVYREGNVKDIILTRRFMVFENRVRIASQIVPSIGVRERNTNQQINFAIQYPGYPLANPRETVKAVLRQNYKWNNAIVDLKPTSVKEDLQTLEYNHFNLENNFAGGNEFRFFDIRSIRFLGQYVNKINPTKDSTHVWLLPDRPRAQQAYSQTVDFNGRYVIDHYETNRGDVEADYVNVHFTLKVPERAPGQVHVWGAFMDWLPGNHSLMAYDEATQTYHKQVMLKQGYYNYSYVLLTPSGSINEQYFEGSFFHTENHYEIIVYYRPIGSRTDLIVGYEVTRHNARN